MIVWVSEGGRPDWQRLATPCNQVGMFSTSLDGLFWLMCGDVSGAGNSNKALFVSSDQGKTWKIRSATAFFFSDPLTPTPPAEWPLMFDGYLDRMLPLSKDEVLVALDRYGMIKSADGGRNWDTVIGGDATGGEPFEWKIARGAGQYEIWAAEESLLFRSVDRGKSWKQIHYPASTGAH